MHRIIFFGTSDFAVPSLEALARDGRFEIVGIVTQPDRPVGRHHEIEIGPLKKIAQELSLEHIWQPEKLNEETFSSWLRESGKTCDAFVIVSYGKILPKWLLELPKKGVVNVHSSLLPRWRGASPVQATIAAGDTMTGVSIMKIDEEMDHGPLIEQIQEPVRPDDTSKTLYLRLFALGGKVLPDILEKYLTQDAQLNEQDHSKATYSKILSRDDGKIDWMQSAEDIERLIRAYTPWPGTWTELNGKRLKILSAKPAVIPPVATGGIQSAPSVISNEAPGEVRNLFSSSGHLYAHCGNNSILEILTLQPEGKKPIPGRELNLKNNY